MGVMTCNRNGCENIMCDYYSQKYGYICYECFNELLDMGLDANISIFMGSIKPILQSENEDLARTRLEREFVTN